MRRRTFVGRAGAVALVAPALARVVQPLANRVRVGIIADVHHGLAPDAEARLGAFVQAANARNVDCVIQMGDFCHAEEPASPFMALWRSFRSPKHHVLGNHDMDKVSKGEAMAFWGMSSRFYAFDVGPVRFIALDLNHIRDGERRLPYQRANFYIDSQRRAWADQEQLAWLRDQLARPGKPAVILSHQPLGMGTKGRPLPDQQLEVLRILEDANRRSPGTVRACLCGHLHVDRKEIWRGIPCLCINSASYFWRGGMLPYRDPLFAFIEIEPRGNDLIMSIQGSRSAMTTPELVHERDAASVAGFAPAISDRVIRL